MGPVTPRAAQEVVRRAERAVPAGRRRRLGVHYTPPALARRLAVAGLDALGGLPLRVLDPCCGAGAVLLAVADELVARGVDPAAVPGRLAGADVDPAAVAAARVALSRWAGAHRVPAAVAGDAELVVADTLAGAVARTVGGAGWAGAMRPADLVVGNPPFLGQLAADTARSAAERDAVARRWPGLGPYTDAAGLHLLAAMDLVRPGGVVVLLQPQSLLSARDASPVRDGALAAADLVALWADDRDLFEAAVRVCAPVLRRRAAPGPGGADGTDQAGRSGARPGAGAAGVTDVRWRDEPPRRTAAPAAGAAWGPLVAAAAGLPPDPWPGGGPAPDGGAAPAGGPRTLGDLAAATAGFRDHFYALAAAAREEGDPGWAPDAPRLVTVGMVDPLRLWWGRRAARLAGRPVVAPRLDVSSLAAASPSVAEWAARRARPKVLVASQTRVPEAVVDPSGDLVPVTPVITVEPHDPADLWRVAAVVLAPPVAAHAASRCFGTGRATGSLRWSAAALRGLPLPSDAVAWERAAAGLAAAPTEGPGLARALLDAGADMCRAYGAPPDDGVLEWWGGHVRRVGRPAGGTGA